MRRSLWRVALALRCRQERQHFLACGIIDCKLSADGLQWQTTPALPGITPTVTGLAWSGTKWVAVGIPMIGTGSCVATSP